MWVYKMFKKQQTLFRNPRLSLCLQLTPGHTLVLEGSKWGKPFFPFETIWTFYKTLLFERRQITSRSLQNDAVKQIGSSVCLKNVKDITKFL
jgi:hypothetical protein